MNIKKPLETGTVSITGLELEEKYASDPEGRFEINTAWGYKELLRKTDGSWYLTNLGGYYGTSKGINGEFSQEEIEELPEILYTHSAFLTEDK